MRSNQPSVYILDIRIDEPVTSFTALLISAVCFYAFLRLGNPDFQKSRTLLFIRYYFLVMAIATANGGIIGHAFLSYLSFGWKLVGWVSSMFSIMLIERASIEYASKLVSKKIAGWLRWINIVELTVFVIITMATLNFFFVEVHTTYGLLIVVASLHLYVYRKTQSKGSKFFLIAVAFAAISALIFLNRLSISPWFNFNDISHVFLTVAAWYFYKGARFIGTEKQAKLFIS